MNLVTLNRADYRPADHVFDFITASELFCKCGRTWESSCPRAVVDPELPRMFANIRAIYRRPIEITCVFRCPQHPEERKSTSMFRTHTLGLAMDILIPQGVNPRQFREVVLRHVKNRRGGFGLYPKYPRLIHMDLFTQIAHRRWPQNWPDLMDMPT